MGRLPFAFEPGTGMVFAVEAEAEAGAGARRCKSGGESTEGCVT